VRNTATEEPWLDEASIRRVTVAGLPAIVYNRYHAPRYQDYIVGLRSDLLLLIDSDATRPEQAAAIEQLTVVSQPSDWRPRAADRLHPRPRPVNLAVRPVDKPVQADRGRPGRRPGVVARRRLARILGRP
jgi:hypothetical protein